MHSPTPATAERRFYVAEEAVPSLAIRTGYKITVMGDRVVVFYEVAAEHFTPDVMARMREVRS
jgi:hypothetical protein